MHATFEPLGGGEALLRGRVRTTFNFRLPHVQRIHRAEHTEPKDYTRIFRLF